MERVRSNKEVLYSFRMKNDFIFRSFIEMFLTANISMRFGNCGCMRGCPTWRRRDVTGILLRAMKRLWRATGVRLRRLKDANLKEMEIRDDNRDVAIWAIGS